MRKFILTLTLALATLACNLPAVQQSAGQSAAPQPAPASTAAAGNPPAVAETPAVQSTGGSISGKVCYPAGGIPPLFVYLKNVQTSEIITRENAENVDHYDFLDVPAGRYIVFAYPVDTTYAVVGGYTQAVPCGLLASCEDHTPIEVIVEAGSITPDADVCDWYAPEGTFPERPYAAE
jgi:hypothetical protein